MKKVAVTGNIASGKSTALNVIAGLNFPVIDCDDIVKKLYEDKFVINLLAINLPFIVDNGKINKQKLSEIIFSDKSAKVKLEMIIFPFVRNEIKKFFETNKDYDKAFVIIPLLFEAQMEKLFDIKIMISADEKIREKRLIARKTLLSGYAKEVIASQMSDSEKEKLSDIVIKNNGTLIEFQNAVKSVITNL